MKYGCVEHAEDWEFSSAAWYASGVGSISIDWFDDWPGVVWTIRDCQPGG